MRKYINIRPWGYKSGSGEAAATAFENLKDYTVIREWEEEEE